MNSRFHACQTAACGILLLVTTGVSAQVVESCTDCPLRVPPAGDTGITTSVLNIGSTGTISDLDVTLNLTHTFDGDLEISLEHVDTGTSVLLSQNQGGAGNDFIDTVFDDEAGTAISAGTPPFTGSFTPDFPLSAFDGEDISGTWNLIINDENFSDSGQLNDWSLSATLGAPEPAVPVPTLSQWALILAAMLLGLVGMARARERTAQSRS